MEERKYLKSSVDPKTYDELKKLAKAKGMSLSQFIAFMCTLEIEAGKYETEIKHMIEKIQSGKIKSKSEIDVFFYDIVAKYGKQFLMFKRFQLIFKTADMIRDNLNLIFDEANKQV